MHDYPIILFLAILTLAYGLISRVSERMPITAPMIFVTVGIAVGPLGLGWFDSTLEDSVIRLVAEITLVSILFVEASTIDLKALLRERDLSIRLLCIGLPLTMILSTFAAAALFPEMSWWLLALMAFMLSPTDAALGQAVVTSERVPPTIRRAIATESGLNDGLVLPPILICMAALGAGASHVEVEGPSYWTAFIAAQLLLGPLAGSLVGWVGGFAVDYCATRALMSPTFQRLAAVCLAVVAWALAEEIGGNGYIAAFVGGLLLGIRHESVRERVQDYAEAEGEQLTLFVFLVFGLAMVPTFIDLWTWESWLYALLCLTVLRMLPVFLSLFGSPLSAGDRLFVGWFGPRGIASVLYLEMVVLDLGAGGMDQMLGVVVLTVLLSVFLHGLSAVPLTRLYGQGAAPAPPVLTERSGAQN
ncbi:MAG: sodium:proton antiporter [Pseudomonadota bacterium]